MMQDQGASAKADRATRASPEPQSAVRLGHSASVPYAGADKLREAKALIERGWTRNTGARNINGESVWGGDPSAISWCALAALSAAHADDRSLLMHFRSAIGIPNTMGVAEWNDAPERTQAEVLAAFDKAIELAERMPA